MAGTTIKHFDILDFVKKSKEYGASEQMAEFQARQIEQAIEIAVTQAKEDIEKRELATKRDLAETKNQIILWVAGLFVASGLIQHFFK